MRAQMGRCTLKKIAFNCWRKVEAQILFKKIGVQYFLKKTRNFFFEKLNVSSFQTTPAHLHTARAALPRTWRVACALTVTKRCKVYLGLQCEVLGRRVQMTRLDFKKTAFNFLENF